MSTEYAVFDIQGGIGKHIAFTAVLDAFKQQYPETKAIIVCAWPEVFTNNPDVYRLYRLGSAPNFYKDYIHRKDVAIHAQEPYKQTSHILKQKNLIDTWCDLIGVRYNNNLPKLFINVLEKERGRIVSANNKPILLFQPFGGPGSEHQADSYSWMRDIHPEIAQLLVNSLTEKYEVVHICYDLHPKLENCTRVDQVLPKKELFAMLLSSSKRLFIDSSLQHAAAALGLPSEVVWTATAPDIFGYQMHHNHTPTIDISEGTVDSYLFDYNFTGLRHECPLMDPRVHDYDKIVSNLNDSVAHDYDKIITNLMED